MGARYDCPRRAVLEPRRTAGVSQRPSRGPSFSSADARAGDPSEGHGDGSVKCRPSPLGSKARPPVTRRCPATLCQRSTAAGPLTRAGRPGRSQEIASWLYGAGSASFVKAPFAHGAINPVIHRFINATLFLRTQPLRGEGLHHAIRPPAKLHRWALGRRCRLPALSTGASSPSFPAYPLLWASRRPLAS